MKRIVYSIWNDDMAPSHQPSFKIDQMKKYAIQIEESQAQYAKNMGAEYRLFSTKSNQYPDIQMDKICLLEKLADEYDELLYLDFDVIPMDGAPCIFDMVNLDEINMLPLYKYYGNVGGNGRAPERENNFAKWRVPDYMDTIDFDPMNVYCKIAAKKSMMMIEHDVVGHDYVFNTGVVVAGCEVVKKLKFGENMQFMTDLVHEAIDDTLFDERISKHFTPNNECFITFLVESNNVPHNELSMAWNFIVESGTLNKQSCYLAHMVNKEFDQCFE